MRPRLVFAAVYCVCASVLAQADVWTWKDANGLVHYSDQPVDGAVRIKETVARSAPAGPSAAAAPNSKDSLAALNKAADATRVKSEAELAVQQDLAKKQEEQCAKAKAAYNDAISARRIYKTSTDGGHEFMSDAEADDYRVKAHADMDSACAASADPSAVR